MRSAVPPLRHVVACLATAMATVAPPIRAQTCAAPQQLLANSTNFVNTCYSDTSLPIVCNHAIALTGPVHVSALSLGYPVGSITVTPQAANFDPVLILMRNQCSGDADCVDAVDTAGPGGSETITLNGKDSGSYFLGISTVSWEAATCGAVMISTYIPTDTVNDGVFRAGMGMTKTQF